MVTRRSTDRPGSRLWRGRGSATAAGVGAAPLQAPLSRERLLAAALEIVDRDGVDGLSMRQLARALGRDPMSLYRHTADKAAVLDGLAELVLAELVLAHPNVVPLLVTQPLTTPLSLRPLSTLRPLEDFLELLIKAGFSAPVALRAYRSFTGFLYGHVLNELQALVDNPDETDDLLRLGLHRLPVREFPRLRALSSALARYDGAAELEQGLGLLLTSLRTLR